MSESDKKDPAGPPPEHVSPLIDQAEIDALLARAAAQKATSAPPAAKVARTPVPPPPPFEPGHDLGLLSQDEINSILAGAKGGTPNPPAPPAAREKASASESPLGQDDIDSILASMTSATPDNRTPAPKTEKAFDTTDDSPVGQAEIDRLLAQADAEPTNFAAAEKALQKIDQAEIDAMLNSGDVNAVLGDDAILAGSPDPEGPLTQAELDQLISGNSLDQQLSGSQQDGVLLPAERTTEEPAISAEAAPLTLGQAELDALLGAHPMMRTEPAPAADSAHAIEEDAVERAARESAQANVGRENLAAAVPDPSAEPLGQDLIDSLLAQAAQSAPRMTTAAGDKSPADSQSGELKERESDAMSLSDDDFADLGISIPTPKVSVVSEPADEPAPRAEDTSPMVQRRLKKGARFPAKIAAAIAASLLVGGGTYAYLSSHRPVDTDDSITHTVTAEGPTLEEAIAVARELMGKGEHVSAMRELGAAIRHAEPGPLMDEARFLHVEAGYRSLPPNPKEVDIETVLKNIEDVVALAPEYSRNPEALAWKAELYERTGALTLARDTYERILQTYPKAPNPDNTLLQLARLALQLNYFEDAENALGRIIADYPESTHKSEAQMMLARCYESTGRASDAVATYATVASERTESRVGAEAALAIARIVNASGDLAGAIQALETRLQTATTTDGNDAVYVELAKAYRAAGKPADAVRIARELLNFYPESPHVPEAVVELTRALDANGESRQALELAQQAADRFEKNAEIAKNRALMLSKTGDTRATAEALEKADKLGANDPAVLLEAGQKFMELSETEKATELLQRVIDKYPGSEEAIDAGVELGRHEYKNGDIAGAIDRLVALAESPSASGKQLAIQSALGDIYTDLGLAKRATAAYEKVAALATDQETLAHAATVLLKNDAMGSALPVIHKVDIARLPAKAGFEFLMAQGRAMLAVDPDTALAKMQQAFEQYPVERRPEDFEYLVRACLETGRTAHARILVSDFDNYVQTHPEDRERLQRTAALWGDALYNAGDYRGALDAYALAIPPSASSQGDQADEGETQTPPPPTRDAVWAKFQRANALLKLDEFSSSLPILDELASSESPYAEDARIKADYARLEQRLRGVPAGVGEGG